MISILLAVVGAAAVMTAAPAQCTKAENRQFDFWVGNWQVVNTADGTPAGKSLIERLYNGCTIRENWSEPGFTGGSLNTYVAADQKWHQIWTDSSGSWRDFVGEFTNGHMVLVWHHPSKRFPGKVAQERMTFNANPDGSVRQVMDQTSDGTTWVPGYDYTYRPVK